MPRDTRAVRGFGHRQHGCNPAAIAISIAVMAMTIFQQRGSTDSTRVDQAVSSSVLMLRAVPAPAHQRPHPQQQAKGTTSRVNMVLKRIAPPKRCSSPSRLCTSGGEKVPSSTTSMAAISRTTAPKKTARPQRVVHRVFSSRTANSSSEPPVTSTIKARINIPRAGVGGEGVHRALRTPSCTCGVPGRPARRRMDSSSVHALCRRRPVIASRCAAGRCLPATYGARRLRSGPRTTSPAQLVVGPRRAGRCPAPERRRQRPRAAKRHRRPDALAQQRGEQAKAKATEKPPT